jgi:DNA-directed RNA polymerase subunit RPC12/RpoP
MDETNPPFTPDQVKSINGFQKSKDWHPVTCPNCGGDLIVSPEGMTCPNCGDYHQNWVHSFMADWEWKRCINDSLIRE